MNIYYKDKKMGMGGTHNTIIIGPYDKIKSDEYNIIYWDYIKNNTVPKMLDDVGKELREYRSLHFESQYLISEIYKIEEWKTEQNKPKEETLKKTHIKRGRPPITRLPIQYESIDEMITNDHYNDIVEITFMNIHLKTLPILPKDLVVLNCYNNLLTNLPALPDTLKELNISNNQFTVSPNLPPYLVYFNCSYNNIEYIEYLPTTIKLFHCSNNNLKQLPEQPPKQICHRGLCHGDYIPENNKVNCVCRRMSYVSCGSNPLESFPKSYSECLKCGSKKIMLKPDKTIVCKDCAQMLNISFKNTPIFEIIQTKFDGDILSYLRSNGDTTMELEEVSSGSDDGMSISYNNID